MRLQRLRIQDFRNYRQLELSPGEGLNLLSGPNAAGKTNLLEAVAMLATGRSPRHREPRHLIRSEAFSFHLAGEWHEALGSVRRLEVAMDASGRRRIRIDGNETRRRIDLVGLVPLVELFPEDLQLASGPPAGRRVYLDRLAAGAIPGYVPLRQEFERILRQRNAALRASRPDRELRALDEPFLDRATRVHAARAEAVRRLSEAMQAGGAERGEDPVLEYWASDLGPERIRARLEERLAATRGAERRLGSTQVGPQRDDFRLRLGGQPGVAHASRGQLRSLLLQLKLGEADSLLRATREPPVILLDDALSDMDPGRRRHTLERLSGRGQVFLSYPEALVLPPGSCNRTFRIASGGAEVVV